jgi:hypothetical protein
MQEAILPPNPTVGQLIEALSKFDPNALVCCCNDDDYFTVESLATRVSRHYYDERGNAVVGSYVAIY